MRPNRWNEADLVIGDIARGRLDEFAGLLACARRTWRKAGSTGLFIRADAGSAAAVEQAALLRPDAGPSGPWRPDQARLPLVVANIFGLAATEHLGALAALFDSGEVIFSVAPLVRVVVEHTCRALWVMDNDITERPRAARAALELLEGARQAKVTAGHLGSQGSHLFAQEHAFQRKEIGRRFQPWEITTSQRGQLVLVGQTLPTMTEAIKRAGELVSSPTRGLSDYLANTSHPTFHTIVESIEQSPTREGGMTWHTGLNDLNYLEKLVRLANGFALDLAIALTSYLGHARTGLSEWQALALKVLPDEGGAGLPKASPR